MKTRFMLSCSLSLLKNQSPSQVMQIIKEKKPERKKWRKFTPGNYNYIETLE